jgi:hypothetical protein
MPLFVLSFQRFLIQVRLHLMDTDWQGFMEFNMNNEMASIHICEIPDFRRARVDLRMQ